MTATKRQPRRNNRARVQAAHPDARAERHRTYGRETYWLIRFGRAFMPFAEGETEAEAWKNAAAKLETEVPHGS